jgi:hypothetical protein
MNYIKKINKTNNNIFTINIPNINYIEKIIFFTQLY